MRAFLRLSAGLVGLLAIGSSTAALAQLIPPAGPASPASAKFTLGDVFLRLTTGATGARRAGAFTEPAPGPIGATMVTTDQVMAAAPAVDDTSGAAVGDVLGGKTYWGLRSGAWGQLAGGMANNGAVTMTPTTVDQPIAAGYHNGTGKVVGDGALLTGNIRAGVTVFGVGGDSNVVNTVTGDAVAGDVLSGKKAWVDGVEITGSGGFVSYPAAVEKTGQTQCYDASNVLTTCPGTPAGQDGALQRGVAWPNPRFTDNGNGTVTDNLTGLIWLKNANCYGAVTWSTAMTSAAALANGTCSLGDGSAVGDWRVPSMKELQSLVDVAYVNPALPNTVGTGQWTAGAPFISVQNSYYWSSSTYVDDPADAWIVFLANGFVNGNGTKTSAFGMWPVRGGQ